MSAACRLSLFVVDRDAAGVTVKDYRTIDNLHAADIRFDNAPATLLGKAGGCVVEANVGCVQVVDGAVVLDHYACGIAVDHKQRQASGIACLTTRTRGDDQLVGLCAMHDHGLLAGDRPAAALLRSPRGDVEKFVARLALAEGNRQLDGAAGHLLQQRILTAGQLQRLRTKHGGLIRLHHQAAAQLLHHHQQVHRTAVETALRFRHRQRGQA